jgi:hypothetical protein
MLEAYEAARTHQKRRLRGFCGRGLSSLKPRGMLGAITSRTGFSVVVPEVARGDPVTGGETDRVCHTDRGVLDTAIVRPRRIACKGVEREGIVSRMLDYPPVTEELFAEVVRRMLAVGAPCKIVLFGSCRGMPGGQRSRSLDYRGVGPGHPKRSPRYLRALVAPLSRNSWEVWTPGSRAWSEVPQSFTAAREERPSHDRSITWGWFLKAESDLHTVKAFWKVIKRHLCFHAQQAAEKYLRGCWHSWNSLFPGPTTWKNCSNSPAQARPSLTPS